MEREKKKSLLANGLILLAIFGRLIPHPSNFTPLGAVSLVGGAKLSKMWRWSIPFIALILSDFLLHTLFGKAPWGYFTLFVYGAFAVNIFLGRWVKGPNRYWRLGGITLLASLQFFLVTNLGVWGEGLLYPPTWEGLVHCYIMAFPFFPATLLGDLIWSFSLFTVIDRSHLWLENRSLQPSSVR